MLKLSQESDGLKVRVKQLTQALQTSLFQRQMNHKVLTEQQKVMKETEGENDTYKN